MLKTLRRKAYIIITTLIRLIATAFAGTIVAALFIDMTYQQRGYYSVGGEWIVIIGLTVAVWKLTGYVARSAWR